MVKQCQACNKEFSTTDGRRKYCDIGCRHAAVELMTTNNWYRVKRRQAVAKLGGKCVSCGFSDARALDIDHVLNNGAQERKVKSPMSVIHSILQDKDCGLYQVLCRNCNYLKYQVMGLGHFN